MPLVPASLPGPGPTSAPILESRDLTIRFGGHVAVNAVSAGFHAGTLTAIVGPNGAGKTTYFNLLSGQLRPSGGEVIFEGRPVTRVGPAERARRGIGRAFQLTNIFPDCTVMENVRLAVQAREGAGLNMVQIWNRRRDLIDAAEHCLSRTGLMARRGDAAKTLNHGDKRKLEIAMLTALDPRVLMFDEPTAGMGMADVPAILDIIRGLKAEGNRTILLVEHKIDVIRQLADRIIVLHHGTRIEDGPPERVMASDIVREAYLGRKGASHG
ncbi:ABC transporter ATP-binding protein [Haematobacter massiliensis]|nr:ABC transporter ATP-binding protein [Haematobacter massiliensis]QBJ26447.1 ABC transporter ATP-binding protein [Haematobacter massiliensis]